MRSLIKISFLTLLVLLISGCSTIGLTIGSSSKPIIDEKIELVDSKSVKAISDINSIALEWKKVDDLRVAGYNIYRSSIDQSGGNQLSGVGVVKNRYATHFADENLQPDTEYSYVISAFTFEGSESRPTEVFKIKTLPAIPAVSFVQAISDMPNQIKILWRPHENERIGYYKIERAPLDSKDWKELDTIKGRLNVEYIDKDLENNEIFMYRVTAITYDELPSIPSEIMKATTKHLPLPANNVVATKNQPKKIIVTWEPSATPDIIGYSLYRNDKENGSYDLVQHFNANDPLTFEDDIKKDGAVKYYKITATDKDGLESTLNMNPTMGASLPILTKPVITLAQIQDEKVLINWQPGDKRAVKYNIFKTADSSFTESNTTQFKDITELRFEDKDIKRGVEYTYVVQSLDEFGIESKGSEFIKLTLPKLNIDK